MIVDAKYPECQAQEAPPSALGLSAKIIGVASGWFRIIVLAARTRLAPMRARNVSRAWTTALPRGDGGDTGGNSAGRSAGRHGGATGTAEPRAIAAPRVDVGSPFSTVDASGISGVAVIIEGQHDLDRDVGERAENDKDEKTLQMAL